jgi:hypothetical protein
VAIKHQDLKNLVIQELLNESINNEGVIDWFRAQSSKATSGVGKAISGVGKTLSAAGEKLKPGDPQIAKKLEKVGDFLQMAQRDKDITQLIMQTDLGKKVFSSQEKSLEEALGQDFVKMMKDKKVTPQEVEAFVAAMNKNKKAKQMLDGLGLDIEVSDQDIEAGKEQGAPEAATAQTQAQPSQPQPDQQVKPGEAQPQTKQDTSNTDIQQQTKRDLKPTQKGTKDAIGTAEYKRSLEGLSSVISNTLNIPTANAQKIIDDIWSQLGGKNGKFTKLTLLEQEFQLNLTKILQNNGIVGLKASNLINKIKEWTKQNSNFVTDKIGQQPPQTPVPASTPVKTVTKDTPAPPAAPAQKDAEVAAKMAGGTNPNPPIDVPRTNSSTIPQSAEPVKSTPPVEDSTGKPINKTPAKTSPAAYADTATIAAMDMEASKVGTVIPPSVYRQAQKQGKDPVAAAREYMDLFLNKQKEARQKEAEESGGRIGESLKRILMEEIFNAMVGKNK